MHCFVLCQVSKFSLQGFASKNNANKKKIRRSNNSVGTLQPQLPDLFKHKVQYQSLDVSLVYDTEQIWHY